MIITVVERNYRLPEDFRERYIGSPCKTWDEARELSYAHLYEVEDEADFRMEHTERGRVYRALHKETGEILREYFVTCAELW
jgi:hypothetical protein